MKTQPHTTAVSDTADMFTHFTLDGQPLRGIMVNDQLWIHSDDLIAILEIPDADIALEFTKGQLMTLGTPALAGKPVTFIEADALNLFIGIDHVHLLEEFQEGIMAPAEDAVAKWRKQCARIHPSYADALQAAATAERARKASRGHLSLVPASV